MRTRGGAGTGIVIVLAIVILVVVGLGFLGKWGLDILAEQVKENIQDNPVILEHIGKIEGIEFDLTATAAVDDEEVFVFDLKGSKGDGVLTANLESEADREKVVAGTLRLPSGEKVDLFPEAPVPGKPVPVPEAPAPEPPAPEPPEEETR